MQKRFGTSSKKLKSGKRTIGTFSILASQAAGHVVAAVAEEEVPSLAYRVDQLLSSVACSDEDLD